MPDYDDINPEPSPRRRAAAPWLFYILSPLVLAALALGLWYILWPQSLARVHGRWLARPLSIHALKLQLDNQTLSLEPGQSLALHPGQKLALSGLDSSRWLNYDLKLSSPDLNLAALTGGRSATLASLLPQEDFQKPRRLQITILDIDQPVASFELVSAYSSLDLAARAEAAADAAAKADYYQKALNLSPDSKQLKDKLIAALIESGQSDRAAELVERELAQNGPKDQYLEQLLNLYEELGLEEKRRETLERLISLTEASGGSAEKYLRQLAALYQSQKRLDKAAEIMERIMAQSPPQRHPQQLAELAALYRSGGRMALESDTLKRLAAISEPGEAAVLWPQIIELEKKLGRSAELRQAWAQLAEIMPDGQDKANAYKTLAVEQVKAKELAEAGQALEKALNLDPKDKNVHLNLARLALAEGRRKDYARHLAEALELDGEDEALRRELAEAHRADNRLKEAKNLYLEILKRKPQDENARLILMDLMEKTGDKKGLLEQYAALAQQKSSDKVIAYNYAVLLFENRNWPEAAEAFKKVLALDPEDTAAREYLLLTYQKRKMNKETVAEALELFRRDPGQTVYRTLILNTCEIAGDWAGYVEAARELAAITPKDPEIWQLLARGQRQLKKNDEAARSLYRAAEAAGSKVQLWLEAGQALQAAGLKKEARQAFEAVQKLQPDNQAAAKALLQLDLSGAGG